MSVKTQSELILENDALQRQNVELRVKLVAYEPWDLLAVSADSQQHFVDKHSNTKNKKGESINERKARIASLEDSMEDIRDDAKTKMNAIAKKKSVKYVVQKAELAALQGLVKIDEDIAAAFLASQQELWRTQAILKQQNDYAKLKHTFQSMQAKGTLTNLFSLPPLEQVMPPLPSSRPSSARSSPMLTASSSSRPASPIAPPAEAKATLSAAPSSTEVSPSLSSTSSSSSPPPMMLRERKPKRKQETLVVDDEATESTPAKIATEERRSKRTAKLDEDSCSSDSTDEELFSDAMDTEVVQEARGAYEAAMAARQS